MNAIHSANKIMESKRKYKDIEIKNNGGKKLIFMHMRLADGATVNVLNRLRHGLSDRWKVLRKR